jgi:hypothetical protein
MGAKVEVYDPSVGQIDDGLLDPPSLQEAKGDALTFGMRDLDIVHPTGIDLDGSLYVVQGVEKNRKTTVVLNWVRHWCRSQNLNGSIIVDILESRSSPKRYKRQLVCMEATAIMAGRIYQGANPFPWKEAGVTREDGKPCRYIDVAKMSSELDPKTDDPYAFLFHLSPRRAMSGLRTPMQHEAIVEAKKHVDKWPLLLFGAPRKQGGTKRLELPGNGVPIEDCYPYKRWAKCVEKHNAKILVIDHTHTYNVPSGFDALEKVAMHIAAAVAQLRLCVIAIAQTSLGTGRQYAKGGSKLAEEATMVLWPKYDNSEAGKHSLLVECLVAEDEPPANFRVPIEPYSGLILPYSYPVR